METLMELVYIVDRFRVDKFDLIGARKNSKTKLDQMFMGIKEGKIKSDDDAIKLLYKNGEDKYNYQKLRARFKERLLNTVLFINVHLPDFSEYNRAYYEGYKALATMKVLVGRSAKRTAAELAEKALKKSQRFEYTELTLQFAKVLATYYSITDKNDAKFRKYRDLTKSSFQEFYAEHLASEYYLEIGYYFSNSRSNKPKKLIKITGEYLKELHALSNQCKTISFLFFYYSIQYFHFDLQNCTREALKLCEQILGIMDTKKFKNRTYIMAFARRMFSCQVKLAQYEEGAQTLDKYLSIAEVGTANWFKFQINHSMLLFYQEKFGDALKLYLQIVNNNRFKYQDEDTKETWRIFGAYLHILISLGRVELNEEFEASLKQFRIYKFMNEVPEFQKDKRGMNVMIITVQIMNLLLQKKQVEIIDKIDALKRYSVRHLRKNDAFRSNCFIQMLARMGEADFDKETVVKKTVKLYNNLKAMPLQVAAQDNDLEVLPYEKLWDYIVSLLSKKPASTKMLRSTNVA